ncbi:TetR/AcrR family transcriptional regulator [Hoyosella sp. YIM 151337]|uniref:TetR/AcrR family transcriptional regulator n=1 Tax=Hoyosella sp. YIM 151337 TaxID=2992742 RepID=UPI00223556AA|nr:TetR/AcrR family transcriptional regulator [Hoyosella sp. YIM 151337]MCW4351769.1 TetR/AcrR family transcriptional regulator [Hoyosella sp. YIM 151337]
MATERTHSRPAGRRGRVAEAERNDAAILAAAREVFVANPAAPISAVAKRAGVGIGALYTRYDSKEDLLGTLCSHGQDIFLDEVERALASDAEPWEAYQAFLRRIVDADTHSLTVRLAGTFTPTEEHMRKAERMRERGTALFDKVAASGAVRPDLTFLDVSYLLELIATSSLGSPARTAELRQRQLAIITDGIRSRSESPLPGKPPTWEEQTARWISE